MWQNEWWAKITQIISKGSKWQEYSGLVVPFSMVCMPMEEITFKGKSVMSKYTELLNFKSSWAA